MAESSCNGMENANTNEICLVQIAQTGHLNPKMYYHNDNIIKVDRETNPEKVRKAVWDYMEAHDIARHPRPVHHHVPNFIYAENAAYNVTKLPEFETASNIFITPDKPLHPLRCCILETKGRMFVSSPGLKKCFVQKVTLPLSAGKKNIDYISSHKGMAKHGVPASSNLKIDLIIIGAVAVAMNGHRIGKGEGFTDLEYAYLRHINAIDENTKVIVVVHTCQIFRELPSDFFHPWDVPADIIVTPFLLYRPSNPLPKPIGFIWHSLTQQKVSKVPALRNLHKNLLESGKNVSLAAS